MWQRSGKAAQREIKGYYLIRYALGNQSELWVSPMDMGQKYRKERKKRLEGNVGYIHVDGRFSSGKLSKMPTPYEKRMTHLWDPVGITKKYCWEWENT